MNISDKELFYESIATNFDNIMNRYEVSKRLDIIYNKLLPKSLKEKTLLDAGCGTGLFSKEAVRRGAKVTSFDVGPKLLNEVAKKCKTKTVEGSVLDMPFKDNCFDIVISTEVIEHVEDPKKAVEELCRVTKPGGILIITTPNYVWKFSLLIANLLRVRPYQANENWLTFIQLESWLNQNKMEILEKRGFNIIPFFHPKLHKLITFIDNFGKLLLPVMVNMAYVSTKKTSK